MVTKCEQFANGVFPDEREFISELAVGDAVHAHSTRNSNNRHKTPKCIVFVDAVSPQDTGLWAAYDLSSATTTDVVAFLASAEEADNSESEDEVESPTSISASTSRFRREKSAKWAKTTLAVLFGGAPKPVHKFAPDDIDKEAELMEALADVEEDARLDDSAIECSDDEYVP
ncbi:hypothetical protein K438DRAFT_1769525 [Mycena galopus ATCC 62051]|nr:hypothetical protein K438DRAFT_1769525 [Mycena galopus ATCC 62051]